MRALISLIAATGLRLGEALALDRDTDAATGTLTVTGKNDQVRLVPVHQTTVSMLTAYARRRDQLCPRPASPAFFITSTGHRAQQRGVQETFARLLALAGIETPPGRRRPRIHDLRHYVEGRVRHGGRLCGTSRGTAALSVLCILGVPGTLMLVPCRPGAWSVGSTDF